MMYRYYTDPGGWRIVVMYRKGRKWLELIDTATFEVHRLTLDKEERLRPVPHAPKRAARRLEKRRALLNRCNIRFSKRAVRAAIIALRSAPS